MLNPRNIFVFLFLFGAFLVGYFGALGKWNDIGVQKVEVLQSEVRLRIADRDLTHGLQLAEFYVGLSQGSRDRVIAALPKDTDLPNLLVHVDRIAKESGVLLSGFTVRDSKGITGFAAEAQEITTPSSLISLNAKGTYTSTKEFFRSLEKFLRIIDIDTISLSSIIAAGDDDAEPLLNITITARTYEFEDEF